MPRIAPDPRVPPEDIDHEVEGERSRYSKTYALKDGRRHVTVRRSPVHEFSSGAWQEIDTNFVAGRVRGATYQLELLPGVIGYRFTGETTGETTVELTRAGGLPVVALPAPTFSANSAFWALPTGLTIELRCLPGRVHLLKHIANALAPRSVTWRVTEPDAGGGFRRRSFGKDADGGYAEMLVTVSRERVRSGRREFDYEEEWTGRISREIDPRFRARDWSGTPVYPVVIDPSTSDIIAAGADDGFRFGSLGWFDYQGYVAVGNNAGYVCDAGLRFVTVNVPQGATISSATITVDVESDEGPTDFIIYGDDSDDAAAWVNGPRADMTNTTASVTYASHSPGTGSEVYTITSIVQEIVDRAGWAANNDMRFGFLDNGSAAYDLLSFDAYDDAPGAEPQLDITYVGGTPSRLMTLGVS